MKEKLRQYIQEELLDGQEVADDENLLIGGLIDSMGVMRLVAFVDEAFHVTVPPEDLTIENFMTIETMIRYLEGRCVG